MKLSIFSFLVLASLSCLAQKSGKKIVAADGITKIEIISDEIFQINIISQRTNKITLTNLIQGEHYEEINVITVLDNGILKIGTAYSPFFKAENDKLSVHKLLSVEVNLFVPENLEVSISSKLASVTASGFYKSFTAGLESGNCKLANFVGNANLQTKIGFIQVIARNNVMARPKSEHGEIKNSLPEIGKYLVIAESISGDISLSQEK